MNPGSWTMASARSRSTRCMRASMDPDRTRYVRMVTNIGCSLARAGGGPPVGFGGPGGSGPGGGPPRRRRVDRLVPVVPLDPISSRLVAEDLADRAGAGRPPRRFGLGDDTVSGLENHGFPFVSTPRIVPLRRATAQPGDSRVGPSAAVAASGSPSP